MACAPVPLLGLPTRPTTPSHTYKHLEHHPLSSLKSIKKKKKKSCHPLTAPLVLVAAAPLAQMYKDDGLTQYDMSKLLDRFPTQPLDFFGALRSSTYDGQIRKWIETDVVGESRTYPFACMSC